MIVKSSAKATRTAVARRRGYRHTPLGWIPNEWDLKALSKGIDLFSGQHVLSEDCNTSGIGVPYLTGPADFSEGVIKSTKWTDKPTTICRKGDILIVVKGAGSGKIVEADADYCISRQLMAIRATGWNNDFLLQFLRSRERRFESVSSGLIPGLSRNDLLLGLAPVPSLQEQKAIVEILLTWDAVISKTAQLISEKEGRKKALMQRLLIGNMRLPGFRRNWSTVVIGEVASQLAIKNPTNKDLVVLSCTKHDGLVPSLAYFGRKMFSDNLSTYKVVPKGAFAYATNHVEEGSIGYQASYREALISPMYTVFKTTKSVNDEFLFALLKTPRYIHQYKKRMEGSINRRGGLRWVKFSKINLTLPPMDEQMAIVAVLGSTDMELDVLKRKLEALIEQRKGLMQKLMTGQIRIKTS